MLREKMKKILIQFVALMTVGMLCLISGCSGNSDENSSPINVRVETAKIPDGISGFTYSGTIEAVESNPLGFAIHGTVQTVLVSEGDYVEAGQLLARLNDITMKNSYEMAAAGLERAEDAYNRLKPMYDRGSLPEIKFIEVETGLQQARASAAIARKNLDDCGLYASAAGYVGSRKIHPGANVQPSVTAFIIVDIKKVYARVSVSESEIARIKKGQIAHVTVGALGYRSYDGVVEEVGVMADPIAHTYMIKIAIDNNDYAIKPGMICEAGIPVSDIIDGVVIPNQAVQVDELGRTFVYSVNKDKTLAMRRYVETGQLTNDGIVITEGLNSGESFVISGQQKLVDNSRVQVIN